MNLPNGYSLQNSKYKLTHVVGQGGFGITYKGVWYTEVKGSLGTVKTEVPIAVKEYFFKDYCYREKETYSVKVHSETGNNLFHKFKEKLIKEARILSDVHHPHIVNVLEVFEENNTAYIAMEYISGLSLKQMMEKGGPLSEDRMLKYIHQIGEALQFVHENNILHLDIKPSNILIDRNDNARLIDFGVSKRYDDEQQETSTTMLTLSKGFAAIEQYDNEGTQNFSPYPDIYSLGATMYNLLTGKIPTESILRATRPLVEAGDLNPAISQETQDVIRKAMEIVPSDRYLSVKEMMDNLPQPSKEILATSSYTGPNRQDEGDTTMLFAPKIPALTNPDEETILNTPEEATPTARKSEKGASLTLFATILVIIASAVAIILYTYKPEQTKDKPVATVNAATHPLQDTLPDTTLVDSENDTTPSTQEPVTEPENKTLREQAPPQNRENNLPENNPVVENNQPSQREIDATYEAFIASGKNKMEAADYMGAMEDFLEANKTKGTMEAANLMNEAQIKAEEKQVADKKALYEEQMAFGNMIVVKKISTGLYGAINEKGEEDIPCIYLVSDRTEDGRAFEREDGLFDIYDDSGQLVKKGVNTY